MARALRLLAPLLVTLLTVGLPLSAGPEACGSVPVATGDGAGTREVSTGRWSHLDLVETLSEIEEEQEDEEAKSALPTGGTLRRIARAVHRLTRRPATFHRDDLSAGTRQSRAPPSRKA